MKKLLFTSMMGLALGAIISCNSNPGKNSPAAPAATAAVDSVKHRNHAAILTAADAPGPNKFALDGTPSLTADKWIKAFINNGHEGNYDHAHHTCIWYCKDAWVRMSKIADSVGAEGVRFYYAKNDDGNYTVVPVLTMQGPPAPSISSASHTDIFLTKNPGVPNCGLASSPVGHLGDVRPDQGASMYSAAPPNFSANTPCPPNQSPHYLRAQDAYAMIYKRCGISGSSNKFNSVSEWFDIGVITSLANAIPANGGIRVYFARHVNPGPYDNNVARHGLVLILTQPAGTYQQDYFACINFTGMYYHHFLPRDPGDGATDNGEECPTNCVGSVWTDPTITP